MEPIYDVYLMEIAVKYFGMGFVACIIFDVVWAIANYFVQLALESRERRKFMKDNFS